MNKYYEAKAKLALKSRNADEDADTHELAMWAEKQHQVEKNFITNKMGNEVGYKLNGDIVFSDLKGKIVGYANKVADYNNGVSYYADKDTIEKYSLSRSLIEWAIIDISHAIKKPVVCFKASEFEGHLDPKDWI